MSSQYRLKIDRPLFGLLIIIVNAVAVFLASVLPYYLPGAIVIPTATVVDVVANGVVVYLTLEEQQLPA